MEYLHIYYTLSYLTLLLTLVRAPASRSNRQTAVWLIVLTRCSGVRWACVDRCSEWRFSQEDKPIDRFGNSFHYSFACICGVPSICTDVVLVGGVLGI